MFRFNQVFLLVVFLFMFAFKNKQVVHAYNVALVEYLSDYKVFPYLNSLDLGNRNAKIYADIIKDIKNKNHSVDIVVFPEATLVSEPLNTEKGIEGMTFVPEPKEEIIPCDSSSEKFTSFFKLLSCTARKYQIYLVINLKEKDNCAGSDCLSRPLKFYNTDVVFDRNGKVIARYRKFNTYLEQDTDRPKQPELITFETDFGKTFGLFTCFDIIYKSPAIDLARSGISNFIFPTLWIPELPFLTTIQVQQMWAQGNDATLLAAGAADPRFGSGGLGIYLGRRGNVATLATPRTDNYYLVGEVPDNVDFNPTCSVDVNNKIAREMDQYTLYKEDLSKYAYKKIDIEESKTIKESLCQEQNDSKLCCNFQIEATVSESKQDYCERKYEYFLVVRSGMRTYGYKTYKNDIEVCGLIACAGDSIDDCAKRFPNYEDIAWPVTFNSIKIAADFPDTKERMQFPNSLLADFTPISPSCTTWKVEKNKGNSDLTHTFSTNVPVTKLLTYGIFGRNYALDVKKNETTANTSTA
ncbi:hypothetical protein WA026_006231 [Henosepilachna vigintioctopunctata]|uniref:CN hydrolase domain-containing protein n=1 Tax=Henosepilachna vigintioctopunctata TaxID=420089 RepID=A0AAW1TJ20_9CUCU